MSGVRPSRISPSEDAHVIICHCRVINESAIADAIDAGATTLGRICQATGAGQDCGTCVFSVRRVLCEHEAAPPVRDMLKQEVSVAAS